MTISPKWQNSILNYRHKQPDYKVAIGHVYQIVKLSNQMQLMLLLLQPLQLLPMKAIINLVALPNVIVQVMEKRNMNIQTIIQVLQQHLQLLQVQPKPQLLLQL